MDVYLFDVDAVLLHPGGYRAALHATLRHFAQQLGLSAPLLTAGEVEVFEAHSIISEWDISAICMAAVVLEGLLAAPALAVPATLAAALAALRSHGALQPTINHALLARRTAAALRPGEYAAQAAARILAGDLRVAADARSAALCALLDHILLHTRDPQQSLTFRIFQNYTLGSSAYSACYGLPAAFTAPGTLAVEDRPALDAKWADEILAAVQTEALHAVIYTARPSLPPSATAAGAGHYSAEAELGARMVGLQALPVVGVGSMQWLAATIGGDAAEFSKPAPLHALAAIACALFAPAADALRAAHELLHTRQLPPLMQALRGQALRVVVFEDSARSIQGTQAAGAILQAAGVPASVLGCGIAQSAAKRQQLAAVGAQLYPDVNAALAAVHRAPRA